MTRSAKNFPSRTAILTLVTASGLAALSWEVLWQLRAGLALGVSAWGTGLTLAITMGGMGAGALLAGWRLRKSDASRPARIYGALELTIGFCGLFLGPAFRLAGQLDTAVYAGTPGEAPLVYMLGITAALGPPALCMGATLPLLGLIARRVGVSLPLLYGLNTLGAAGGVLLTAFLLIPWLGLNGTGCLIAGINLAVAVFGWQLNPVMKITAAKQEIAKHVAPAFDPATGFLLAGVTGFATLALEVAWFRSLTAAFTATTGSFAIMLSIVLLALGFSAGLVGALKKKKVPLGLLVGAAGVLILLASPLIERFDLIDALYYGDPLMILLNRFTMTLYALGPPVLLLGLALPWLLDDIDTPGAWGRLYAVNTLSAIGGAVGAAWLLLPSFGFARTAWLAGTLVAAAGVYAAPKKKRAALALCTLAALAAAMVFESGAGRTRVQGHVTNAYSGEARIIESLEGPEATVSAVEYAHGGRGLVIDGFVAASEFSPHGQSADHYMAWMGSLPMLLLQPHPEKALVICFGTGQTANAVRKENPKALDIVDINARVLKMAHNFDANQRVLDDKRVTVTVMDGRAWLRRTEKRYDVITLEPMPPNFAGVNALYSREFYELAAARLTDRGVIAQWLPLHIVGPHYVASIVRTFRDVFPNALLWVDPTSKTGILVGTKDGAALGSAWPGFARNPIKREYSDAGVRKAVLLDSKGVALFAATGDTITDNNQLLAYGEASYGTTQAERDETTRLLNEARTEEKTAAKSQKR